MLRNRRDINPRMHVSTRIGLEKLPREARRHLGPKITPFAQYLIQDTAIPCSTHFLQIPGTPRAAQTDA